MFTEEEKRFIKYELGVDMSFNKPEIKDLDEVWRLARLNNSRPDLRASIIAKVKEKIQNVVNS